MTYNPVTPFRRAVDAAVLAHHAVADGNVPKTAINKYEALRELSVARLAFGLSDRDITVLQALVSFQPGASLGGEDAALVVYPSNRAICERLNGMANSTMRRHLSHLVASGLVLRRDSPNGKRYARRYGDETVAYGFDLSPLVIRFPEICSAARAARDAQERHKRLRETVSLMRRDLAGLAAYGADTRPDLDIWDAYSDLARLTARDLRRNLDTEALEGMQNALRTALDAARPLLEPLETEEMSTNDAQVEQHYQNSNPKSYDLEPCFEKARVAAVAVNDPGALPVETEVSTDEGAGEAPLFSPHDPPMPNIPLGLVLASCDEFKAYAEGPVRHWHDLVRVADRLRPMLGISPSAWAEAKTHMGPEEASVVLVSILERFADIRSPGGYLRALTAKAALGQFSCGPMVMALLRREAA